MTYLVPPPPGHRSAQQQAKARTDSSFKKIRHALLLSSVEPAPGHRGPCRSRKCVCEASRGLPAHILLPPDLAHGQFCIQHKQVTAVSWARCPDIFTYTKPCCSLQALGCCMLMPGCAGLQASTRILQATLATEWAEVDQNFNTNTPSAHQQGQIHTETPFTATHPCAVLQDAFTATARLAARIYPHTDCIKNKHTVSLMQPFTQHNQTTGLPQLLVRALCSPACNQPSRQH